MSTHTANAQSYGYAALPAFKEHASQRIEYQWINAERSGDPIALFLHEGLGSIGMWKDWPQQLCDALGMRGLVYARPGYGRSTPRPHHVKLTVDFMAIQATEVLPVLLDMLGLDAWELRRMWVIGHSDGGSIALLYAATFPEELAGVVAIAPHVFVEDITIQSIAQAKIAYEESGLRDKLKRYHDDVDSAFYGWNDVWLSPAFRPWNIVDTLASIRRPLLAVQGENDHYGTMAQIETIGREVSHAQLSRLPDCGHSPHRDASVALTRTILEFVSKQ